MYINPFIAGIITTFVVETLIVLSLLTWIIIKGSRIAENEIKRVSRKTPK